MFYFLTASESQAENQIREHVFLEDDVHDVRVALHCSLDDGRMWSVPVSHLMAST